MRPLPPTPPEQLDLFAAATCEPSGVLDTLASDPGAALAALAQRLEVRGLDGAAAAARLAARAWAVRGRARTAAARGRLAAARALELGLAPVPDALVTEVHTRLLRNAAAALEEAAGPAARLDGLTAGELWLAAGDPVEAERALAALVDSGAAATGERVLLGTVQYRLGRKTAARETWRDALRDDPLGVDLASIPDPEVRALTASATDDYECVGDPRPWLPAVGYVEGVFTLRLAAIDRRPADDAELAGLLEPVQRADRFCELLQEAETGGLPHGRRVAARRALLGLQPTLGRACLDRALGRS